MSYTDSMTSHIERLRAGLTVQYRPHGNSMQGKIASGQLVTIEPVRDPSALKIGDIVLAKVHGHVYLHLIKAIQVNGVRQFQIANNKGHVNGWCSQNSVFGRCTKVED